MTLWKPTESPSLARKQTSARDPSQLHLCCAVFLRVPLDCSRHPPFSVPKWGWDELVFPKGKPRPHQAKPRVPLTLMGSKVYPFHPQHSDTFCGQCPSGECAKAWPAWPFCGREMTSYRISGVSVFPSVQWGTSGDGKVGTTCYGAATVPGGSRTLSHSLATILGWA